MNRLFPLAASLLLLFLFSCEKQQQLRQTTQLSLQTTAPESKNLTIGSSAFAVRFIPPGRFKMGATVEDSEGDNQRDDEPQRHIQISKGFWMMETEVTQAQYKAITGKSPSTFKTCGEDCPVERVSWHDAAFFANQLSTQQGKETCFVCEKAACQGVANYPACRGWRLPTEAEWEYAARAGTSSRFFHGKCLSFEQANFNGSMTPKGCTPQKSRINTLPVKSFPPNAWGLFDMHGNVAEWVFDGYLEDAYKRLPTTDPYQHEAPRRVIRGGGWNDAPSYVQASGRNRKRPFMKTSSLGFRLLSLQ